jgi:caffeoyl-CoA O-methyltransferase
MSPNEADEKIPGIVTPAIDKYMQSLLRPREEVLSHLEKDAEKNHVPIVGPLVGNLLSMLATSIGAKNIIEIGTATGYSGIWLARVAKKNGGKFTTIEADPERRKIATKSFDDAGLSGVVEILGGDAKKIVPDLAKKSAGKFDIAFIDVGDKKLYVDLLSDCVDMLRMGGFLLADNVLWDGYVADPSTNDAETKTIREFNKRVYADKRLQPVIVPLRDGVMVAMKV